MKFTAIIALTLSASAIAHKAKATSTPCETNEVQPTKAATTPCETDEVKPTKATTTPCETDEVKP
ncbi:hypothetical protein HDU92_005346, partial [Lobulomyces angularis]